MRRFLALALTSAVAVSAAACNSGSSSDTTTTSQTLSVRDFKNKVAAAIITGSDLQADPGFGLKVDVSEPNGLDTVQLVLDDAYKQYRAAPAKQQEVVQRLVHDAVAQMQEGNSKRSFADVQDQLMPMLKRRAVVESGTGDPAVTPFHDLDVVYAVQREHSFTLVTKEDVKRWGRSLDQIDTRAISNLERETNAKQKLLCEPSGGQKLCGWASGDGYDATRMLVPGLRRQIVQQLGGPAVYAVPLESVFVALTRNYSDVIKGKVLQEFTTGKNPLSPELFEERNAKLVVLAQ